jgi:leucyl-tRNA---protein transferase
MDSSSKNGLNIKCGQYKRTDCQKQMEDRHVDDTTPFPSISERIPMDRLSLSPDQFDAFLSFGWRFLGDSYIRHSYGAHFGNLVRVIPGRIVLEGFEFSKSQRKLLRRGHQSLRIEITEKAINASDERLFDLHSDRFIENQPMYLAQMVHYNPITPQKGYTVRVYADDVHVATSFFHIGDQTADSTYCVYDPSPAYAGYSLGHLTLLVEIGLVQQMGLKYYYLGYRYSKRSHFDYKANFNNLEKYLNFRAWVPCERIPPAPYDEMAEYLDEK